MSNFHHVTVAEAATRLHLSRSEILRRIKTGALPAEKLPGRTGSWLIPIEALTVAEQAA